MSGRRVLLVDLAAREGGFVGDSGLSALAAPLAAAGAEVSRVAIEGPVEALRAALPEGGVDLVVLGRAPGAELIAALRSLLPDAALVRFSSSRTEAALDGRFDHVVDAAGAVALAAGDAGPRAPLAWRPTATAERRARLALAPVAAVGAAGRRPAIRGPSDGCPYLRDARAEPAFAALALDPTRVQTKGCTFCLDNDGSYVASSEEATLAAWLGGLRAVRAADPAAREVLLTDERPHPFLPALFRALASDPLLAGVELLVKSRVDWLLEFERELAEAAELAAASGSVLHVYLVGFESFAEEDLRLFNKGHDVAASRRAIDLLAALAARFPASFEHRRLRAHGIVLFTPWTTPETLLENARVMREVGFHELRAEAVRTRLRLYPRTPLYHLAQEQGLLEERFDEARPDRAEEQGYDASAPWRFRDGRVEAIWRAATSLVAGERSIADADAVELATRFVLRWPELAADPGSAPVLLRHALSSWDGAPAVIVGVLGAAAGVDRELEAVRDGGKPASLRERVPAASAAALVTALETAGLRAAIVSEHALDPSGDVHRAGASHRILAAARDAGSLAAVLEAQRGVERGDAAAILAMAALMGYPRCCAEAFAALRDRRDNAEDERAPFARHPAAPLHPLLNRLGRVQLISHHLCAPDCPASVRLAEAALARVERVSSGAAQWVRDRLAAPVLFLDYGRRYELAGASAIEPAGDDFRVLAVTALASPVPAEAAGARRLRLSPAGVAFADEAGAVVARIPAARPLLVVPGQPLSPAALRALAGEPDREGARSLDAPSPALPALPAAFRRGVRTLGYAIVDVRRGEASHEIVLGRGASRIAVRAWARPPEGAVRAGAFAVTVEGLVPGDVPGREAVSLVLRALARASGLPGDPLRDPPS